MSENQISVPPPRMKPSASRRVNHLCGHLANAEEALPFNPEDVKARYEHERDIRIARRPEGTAQYTHIVELAAKDARFARMLEDPWCEVPERSAPKTDVVEVRVPSCKVPLVIFYIVSGCNHWRWLRRPLCRRAFGDGRCAFIGYTYGRLGC